MSASNTYGDDGGWGAAWASVRDSNVEEVSSRSSHDAAVHRLASMQLCSRSASPYADWGAIQAPVHAVQQHLLQQPQTAANQWGSNPVYGAHDSPEFGDSPLESISQFVALSEPQIPLHGALPARHVPPTGKSAETKALGWQLEQLTAPWGSQSPQRSRQPALTDLYQPLGPRQAPVGPPAIQGWHPPPPLTAQPQMTPTRARGRYAAQQTAQENQPTSPSVGGVRFLARPVAHTMGESLVAPPLAAQRPQRQRYVGLENEDEGGHKMPCDQWGRTSERQHLQELRQEGNGTLTQSQAQGGDPLLVARLLTAEGEVAESHAQEDAARAELAALLHHSEGIRAELDASAAEKEQLQRQVGSAQAEASKAEQLAKACQDEFATLRSRLESTQGEARTHASEALDRCNTAADEAERWKDECLHLKKELAAHNRKMELRLAEDRSMDSALVRLKHEHVQLKAVAERTAAELHQLRANRRGDPDEVGLLVRRLQAAEAAAAEGEAKNSAMRAGMQDMEDRNAELAAQLWACEREVSAVTGRYRRLEQHLLSPAAACGTSSSSRQHPHAASPGPLTRVETRCGQHSPVEEWERPYVLLPPPSQQQQQQQRGDWDGDDERASPQWHVAATPPQDRQAPARYQGPKSGDRSIFESDPNRAAGAYERKGSSERDSPDAAAPVPRMNAGSKAAPQDVPWPYSREEGGLELPAPHAQHERGAGARRFLAAEGRRGPSEHSVSVLRGDSPQSLESAASTLEAKPYATEESLQDLLARTADDEKKLMLLMMEKQQLLAEHGRMPAHAGRTLRERQRKTEVEQRLEGLDREASLLRLHLKRVISQT